VLKIEAVEFNAVAGYRDGNPPANPGLPLLLRMEKPADAALAAEPPSFAQHGPRIISREQAISGDTSSRAFSPRFTSQPSENILQNPPAVHFPPSNASDRFELPRGLPVHDPSSQDCTPAQLSSDTTEAKCSMIPSNLCKAMKKHRSRSRLMMYLDQAAMTHSSSTTILPIPISRNH
jgi:hypothetical protein